MDSELKVLIKRALEEDMPHGDITSDALFTTEESEAVLSAKASGVVSGLDIAKAVFEAVDETVEFKAIQAEGATVEAGDYLAFVRGKTKNLLKAERTALNFLQRMSGISTATRKYVDKVRHTDCKILDTRKTAPTLRAIDKLAVVRGGGYNHRFSLSDMALIKDNHIHAAGSIEDAVAVVRSIIGSNTPIEVEVETFEQFQEAQLTDCNRIMLDNMSLELMRRCVQNNHAQKELEASGNVTLDRVASIAETGVHFISVGALTHSVEAFDISMKFSY